MPSVFAKPMTKRRRLTAIAVTLFMMVGIVPVATAQPAGISAGEGDWIGFVSFIGAGPAGPAHSFQGSFGFTSAGGELDGTFGWASSGVSMAGVVTGPSTMPQFILTSGTTNGSPIPDVTGGGEIQFTASTCERLEGIGVNWDQVFANAATITDVIWWAVRDNVATDPGAFFEAVDALRSQVNDVVDGIIAASGVGVTLSQIAPLIAEAERVGSALNRSDGCGLAFYRSVIANEIARLVDWVITHPGISDAHFAEIMLMGVRAGLMGSGAETGAGSYESRARDATAARIAAAVAAMDRTALDYLAWLSADMGWDDLEREAILGIVEVGY